ncbi:type II CAAX endopeptidase family protein [Amphritea pacifica]|uniref:CPBP family intramembrane metalloprotease n=1 Tax=Amphritea pacifica TaxID=2811233 RepID=A0ABS2WCX0_9GAMM|nr:type II CAAX endopeptidase family protein [Amphritea pacifica]MBN0989566.1 CPBP family intramembrane metalloprotease [Amphritea pacifica]
MISEGFRYRPVKYFLAVILTTTLFWSLGGYMSFKPEWAKFYMLPMLLGLMMPACLAIGFVWRQPKRAMKQDFIRRAVSVRLIRPWPFIGSLALMPLSVVIAISLSLLFGGSREQFAVSEAFSFNSGFVPVLVLLFLAALFEELGWRGYGFESIEQGSGFCRASLIFGVLWSLWHLPLLWVNHSYQYEIYQQSRWFAVNFFVGTALMGVIVSWVCHLNNRSILATILFHFAINLSQEALSMTQPTKCLQTLVLAVFVLLIVSNQWSLFRQKKANIGGYEHYQ